MMRKSYLNGKTIYISIMKRQYRDCYGLFPLKIIYKVFHHFHFQFATYGNSVNMNV